MNPSLHLRLTPSTSTNSPYTPGRPSPLRSPTKQSKNELGITLKQVIGSTATSRNAFDSNGTCFAYTAGAAAVVATYDIETRKVEQRFFRAKPTAFPINPTPIVYNHGTPTQTPEPRTRATPLRHAGQSNSPFGSPNRDWGDSSTGKSWSAKERVKAASCVSLSPNGLFLAVGETGYNPRVIIFSTATGASPDVPLTCLTDHTFGVRCVAFSPDSRYLASLGAANDGFLYIWRINERTGAATLAASNKCTSNITQIIWMGTKVVTIGTRHVKIWRVEDSNPSSPAKGEESTGPPVTVENRILPGRNCVLGGLLEATFASAVTLTPNHAVLCSDSGSICLLHDFGGHVHFKELVSTGTAIRAALLVSDSTLLLACSDGKARLVNLQNWIEADQDHLQGINGREPQTVAVAASHGAISDVTAFIGLNGLVGTLSSKGAIGVSELQQSTNVLFEMYRLPAHGGPVLGVRATSETEEQEVSFFTWAGDGSIMLWRSDGTCAKQLQIPVEQRNGLSDGFSNELRVVRYLSSKKQLVTGDRLGVLRICDATDGGAIYTVRAHSAEITDITIHDGDSRYIASAGRDRVIQVFHEDADNWELLHTLDEHVGAVTGVSFSKNGENLVSCSSDRTVVVRERASRQLEESSEHAFIICRTITLKSTPMAMTFDPAVDGVVFLSTIDRFVHRYNYRSGRLLGSFKSGDTEGGDNVVMSALVTVPTLMGGSLLAGLSSTDKSIRLYDESGLLLARDWGHTEGVSDIATLNCNAIGLDGASQASLVTVALDGTVFTWQADLRPPKRHDAMSKSLDLLNTSQFGTPETEESSILSRPPLRRVLSQSEVASFKPPASPESEETPTRPASQRSPPRVRRRVSRMSILNTPKLEPSPSTTSARNDRRRSVINQSPPPPSPKLSAATLKRRKSMYPELTGHTFSKPKSTGNLREAAASSAQAPLARDTDSTCKNLRIYRKKLVSSAETIPQDTLREVQKELSLTLRAVGEKAMRPKASQVDEEVLGRVLDQYSSKLVEMLDTRLAGFSLGASTSSGATVSVESLSMGSSILNSPIEEHTEEQSQPGRTESI